MKPVEIAKSFAMFLVFYVVTIHVVKPIADKAMPPAAGKTGLLG